MFRLCSHLDMTSLDPDSIAFHLEAALALAPVGTLKALQDEDWRLRRKAAATIARHLATRLERSETYATVPAGPEESRLLFPE